MSTDGVNETTEQEDAKKSSTEEYTLAEYYSFLDARITSRADLKRSVLDLYRPITDKEAQWFRDMMEALDTFNTNDPIILKVCCGGGSVMAGLDMLDVIRQSRRPVFAYVGGYCASMAVWIVAACDYREASPLTEWMIHEASWMNLENLETASTKIVDSHNALRLQKKKFKLLSQFTGTPETKWKEYIGFNPPHQLSVDREFTSQEAKKLGIIDRVRRVDLKKKREVIQ